jgi:hypothetical protein
VLRTAGGKHFSVVVTAHWQGSPQTVQHYCYKSVDQNGVQFLRPDKAVINKWKKGLQVCVWGGGHLGAQAQH